MPGPSMRRALVVGATCLVAGGCGWYRTHFPARDEVFKPIPLSVGERRVSGADTSYAIGGDGFELVAPDQELLPDAKRALDYASREFGRVFGLVPPPVRVEVRWREATRGTRRTTVDSVYRRPDGRRALAVTVPRPPRERRERERQLRYASPLASVAPAVARAWVSGHADGAPPRRGGATTVAAGDWTLRDDPRLPDWLEEATVALIAPSPWQEAMDARLASDRDSVPALADFFVSRRPGRARDAGPRDPVLPGTDAAGGTNPIGRPPDAPDDGPGRRERGSARRGGGRRVQARMPFGAGERFAAQAHSVALYLVRREGRAFMGQVVDRVLEGEPIERALAAGRRLPMAAADARRVDLATLDRMWRGWLLQGEDLRSSTPP